MMLISQEVPEILRYDYTDYRAGHQNWNIAESCEGELIVANSAGVMIFNGFVWRTIALPKQSRARSVYGASDCRIYVGGYETFGYIDMADRSNPRYVDIGREVLKGSNQEIWRIYGDEDELIFQSFSRVYNYDFETVTSVVPPSNIMPGNRIDDQYYLPKIGRGIFRYDRGVFTDLNIEQEMPPNSEIAEVTVASVHPLTIATRRDGLFFLTEEEKLVEVNPAFNHMIKDEEINRLIHLSEGGFAIGTILNGLYITDENFNVTYHINQKRGLSNNTVLALYEDRAGNLIVGLNKGLNIIKLRDPTRFYYDYEGQIGTIFSAIHYKNTLYLATNRGVFRQLMDGGFKLIPNTQGQAWSFLNANGALLCGHNKGTFWIREDHQVSLISDVTGGRHMVQINDSLILQATYTGLILITNTSGSWKFDKRVKGSDHQFMEFALIEANTLYGLTPYNSLITMTFSPDYHIIDAIRIDEELDHQPISTKAFLITINDQHIIVNDEDIGLLHPDSIQMASSSLIAAMSSSALCLLTFLHENYPDIASDRIHLFTQNEKTDPLIMLATQEGYQLSRASSLCAQQKDPELIIDYISVSGLTNVADQETSLHLGAQHNDVVCQLRKVNLLYRPSHSLYQLMGWDKDWSPIPPDGKLDFKNLSAGSYILRVGKPDLFAEDLLLTIEPVWYQSKWAYAIYILLLLSAIYLILLWNRRKLIQNSKRLLRKKEKEMEAERIKLRNEKLQKEVKLKSKMLANSAMSLIQKKKLLAEMNDELSKIPTEELSNSRYKQRLQSLIRKNNNSDDDWQLFETSFSEVHEDFIKRLTEMHPTLTQGEVRLASFIKMGLGSKEIAPLMHISTRSVENKRYRLRNKIGITGGKTLKRYIKNL